MDFACKQAYSCLTEVIGGEFIMNNIKSKILISSLLLFGISGLLMLFKVCDRCSYIDTSGIVHDNAICCLGPLLMVFLGIIGLTAVLILKIITWIKNK